MKSISANSFEFIAVVDQSGESNSSSSSSSDIFSGRGEEDGSESDGGTVSSIRFLEFSTKENLLPRGALGGGEGGVKRRHQLVYVKAPGDEYHRRRERNNLAVRKSRDKAKQRQKESLHRLQELTAENKRLQMKAELLMKELYVLKGLFPTIGETPPPEVDEFLAD